MFETINSVHPYAKTMVLRTVPKNAIKKKEDGKLSTLKYMRTINISTKKKEKKSVRILILFEYKRKDSY